MPCFLADSLAFLNSSLLNAVTAVKVLDLKVSIGKIIRLKYLQKPGRQSDLRKIETKVLNTSSSGTAAILENITE